MKSSGTAAAQPSFSEAFRTWIKVALLSFGGPAAQIAVMHRILVEEKKWVSESRFLHALNYCMLLPGPEAQQLATYIGWLLHRTPGGLAAGLLFILPGMISILVLSTVYAVYQGTFVIDSFFFGLKAAVLAVVIEAVIRIGKKALKNETMMGIAAMAFIALFFFAVPFPAVILTAGFLGLFGGIFFEKKFLVIKPHDAEEDNLVQHTRPSIAHALRVLSVWLPLWAAPVLLAWFFFGRDHVLTREGLFFSRAAMVTFGGAYSVLAYVAQEAVHTLHWLQPGEMLDGLGMAETTPGPLIMVLQFVGFMGAYRHPEPFSPLGAAVLGALMTTWSTFAPCFLWIFLGAPYIEHLRGNKRLSCALSAITAAVVGVILNLAIWFFLHVIFGNIQETRILGMRWYVPDLQTLSPVSLAIAAAALVAMVKFKKGMIPVLAAGTICGMIYRLTR